MFLKYGLVKEILVAIIFGIILGIILGITKTGIPIWGNVILGAIVAPISISIYTRSNKK